MDDTKNGIEAARTIALKIPVFIFLSGVRIEIRISFERILDSLRQTILQIPSIEQQLQIPPLVADALPRDYHAGAAARSRGTRPRLGAGPFAHPHRDTTHRDRLIKVAPARDEQAQE
jgi:hypothetical protein